MLVACATLAGNKSPGCILRALALLSATLHKCFLSTSVSLLLSFRLSGSLPLFSAVRCPDPECQKVFGVGSHPPAPAKDENFPQCLAYPRVRAGKRNLDLSIPNGGGWV